MLATGNAEAQRYVTFGDSLSDNGNLFAATGQPPAPYARVFSNGPVWITQLAGAQAGWTGGLTPAGSVNFAFGGSRTDTLATPGPGTQTQVNAFFAGGGTLAASDIVTMWAGANNIFQAIAVPANQNTTAMGAVAVSAATDVATQVGQLAAGGARTIVVMNLPDLGRAPNFNTSPASPLATFTVGAYNSALSTALGTVAAANPNTRILQVDAAALFATVIANPTAFGFANVSQQCLTTVACVTGSTATQNSYLFWDGVHPTQAGHRFVAAAVAQYLSAGDRAVSAASINEVTVRDRRMAAMRAFERLDQFRPQAGKTDIYISIIGDAGRFSAHGAMPAYTSSAVGLEMGMINHLTAQTSLGYALSVKTGAAASSVAGNKLTYNPTTFAGDIMARWNSGTGSFVQAVAGASFTHAGEYERNLNIAGQVNKASPNGHAFSFITRGGHDFVMGKMTLTPSVKLGMLSGATQSFQETGAIAPLSYRGRTISTLVAGGEIKLRYMIQTGLQAHALVGYEAFLGQTGKALRGALVGSPGSDFSRNVGRIESPGLVLGVGLSGMISGVEASADYNAAIGAGGQAQHRGSISGKVNF